MKRATPVRSVADRSNSNAVAEFHRIGAGACRLLRMIEIGSVDVGRRRRRSFDLARDRHDGNVAACSRAAAAGDMRKPETAHAVRPPFVTPWGSNHEAASRQRSLLRTERHHPEGKRGTREKVTAVRRADERIDEGCGIVRRLLSAGDAGPRQRRGGEPLHQRLSRVRPAARPPPVMRPPASTRSSCRSSSRGSGVAVLRYRAPAHDIGGCRTSARAPPSPCREAG